MANLRFLAVVLETISNKTAAAALEQVYWTIRWEEP